MTDIAALLKTPLETSNEYLTNPQTTVYHKIQKIQHHKNNNPGYLCIETEDHLPALFVVVNGFRLQSRFEGLFFQMLVSQPFLLCNPHLSNHNQTDFQWLSYNEAIDAINTSSHGVAHAFADEHADYLPSYEYLQPTSLIAGTSSIHPYSSISSSVHEHRQPVMFHFSVEHAPMVNNGCLIVLRPVSSIKHCELLHTRMKLMMEKFSIQSRSAATPTGSYTILGDNGQDHVKLTGNQKKKAEEAYYRSIDIPYYITPSLSASHQHTVEGAMSFFLATITQNPLITRYATTYYPILDRCSYVDQIFSHNPSMWESLTTPNNVTTDQDSSQCTFTTQQLHDIQLHELTELVRCNSEAVDIGLDQLQVSPTPAAAEGDVPVSDPHPVPTREALTPQRKCIKINNFPKQLNLPVYQEVMKKMHRGKVDRFLTRIGLTSIPSSSEALEHSHDQGDDVFGGLNTPNEGSEGTTTTTTTTTTIKTSINEALLALVTSESVLDDFDLNPNRYSHMLSVCVLFNTIICFSLCTRQPWMDPKSFSTQKQIRLHPPASCAVQQQPPQVPTDQFSNANTTNICGDGDANTYPSTIEATDTTPAQQPLKQHDYLLNSKVDTVISRAYFKLSEAFQWIDSNEHLFHDYIASLPSPQASTTQEGAMWGWWRSSASSSSCSLSTVTNHGSVLDQPHQPPIRVGIDVGASPGGWSLCLAQLGLKVFAIDPGKVLCAHENITHIPYRIESKDCLNMLQSHMMMMSSSSASSSSPTTAAVSALQHQQASIVVCDMNMEIIPAIHLIKTSLIDTGCVRHGALLILTLKSFSRAHIPQELAEATETLESIGYHHVQSTWLFSNRKERTIIAIYR